VTAGEKTSELPRAHRPVLELGVTNTIADGPEQHAVRGDADFLRSMDVPGRSALRVDCIGHYSGRLVPRGHHYGITRRVRLNPLRAGPYP
jgi:hypothetical protein